MYILSVNAGSSSLKISLYSSQDNPSEPLVHLLTASVSSISSSPSTLTIKPGELNVEPSSNEEDVEDHSAAFVRLLHFLEHECSIPKKSINHVCHRVVHGGDYYTPVVVDSKAYHHIERLSDLAPLHNGPALSVIKFCTENIPEATSIAYFDTTFHRSLPMHISNYLIDPKVSKERGLKKYGFHGISYAYILRSVAQYLHKSAEDVNLIMLHLGSGASACAVLKGKSFDTSMGLTPVSGLPGATRSGAVDPSLIFHYTNKAGKITHDPTSAVDVQVTMAEDILNRKSGWKAVCGTTNFAEVVDKAELDNSDPTVVERNPYRLAYDTFVDKILGYVGSYYVKLGGEVDALVFSGGIGEKSWQLRKTVGDKVRCLGFQSIDPKGNKRSGKGLWDIGAGEGTRILVCETDEQYEMARQCVVN